MTAEMRPHGLGWPLVILAGMLMVLSFVVLLPVADMFIAQSDAETELRQQLDVYRAQIAARERLAAELAAAEQQEASAAALLRGDNAALAAAAMQGLVKALVERHGGQVRSAQMVPVPAAAGLQKVVVQFELAIPRGSLKAATYALETGTPYLFLDSADIQPETFAGASAAPDVLRVLWSVHGYRRAGKP